MTNIPPGIKMNKPMMFETAIKDYQSFHFCPEDERIQNLFFLKRKLTIFIYPWPDQFISGLFCRNWNCQFFYMIPPFAP